MIGECVAMTNCPPRRTKPCSSERNCSCRVGDRGRFRLVHQVQSVVPEAVLEQREERLPVRLLVQRLPAVAVDDATRPRVPVQPVDFGGDVIEALGPEKIAVAGPGGGPGQPDALGQ